MRHLYAMLLLVFASSTAQAQLPFHASELQGTWQLVSAKNVASGSVLSYANRVFWLQFTKSHWTLNNMALERPIVTALELARAPEDERIKKTYSSIWNDRGEQVATARGGTYTFEGNEVRAKRVFTLFNGGVGGTDIMIIQRLTADSLIYLIPGGEGGTTAALMTARRID